ncbi:hypothetical protein IMSHALPRED_003257 [Imshaugia aleurites]|uniref:BTB domain-containing protein n=1 Tax=Imshaugia aleurites TaxID=172621 RepID=A0A8H3F314_9LECA|nr:hypothetical protein IMSHALPRED_003257 [Imshaugia aleurites]
MPGITTLDDVPAKKKHITKTKEITTTVPKTIVLPNPSTPTRYGSIVPTSRGALKPYRHLFKTPVTLAIGRTNAPFHLHLEALCSVSPFFSAAFNPTYSFRESVTCTLSLPECNPTDFEYFAQWLYTRTLTHESLDGPHPAYFKLIKLWKLASFLGITALKNSIVDEIGWRADETNSVPTPDDTRSLWGGDEDMFRLKELVVDLFVW